MAAAAISLIPSIGGLISGYFQRQATKKAGTVLANAYQSGADRIGSTTERSVNRIGNAASMASEGLGGQTTAAQNLTHDAARDAVNRVSTGTDAANAKLQDLLTTQTGNLNPYLAEGRTGADRYVDLLTNPQEALANTPGYQFQLQQGLAGVQSSAAARGALRSGGTLKALDTFGQGLAGTTYQQAIQNALSGSDRGLQATNQYGQAQQAFGVPQANNTLANARYGADVGNAEATRIGDLGTDYAKTAGGWNTSAAKDASAIDLGGNQAAIDLLLGRAGAEAGSILGNDAALTGMIGSGASGLQALLKNWLKKTSGGGSSLGG